MTQNVTTRHREDQVRPYDGNVPLFERLVDGPWHGEPLPPDRYWMPAFSQFPTAPDLPANRYGHYRPELVDGVWQWVWKKRPYGYRRKMEPLP